MSKSQNPNLLCPHEVSRILRSVRLGLCTARLAAELLHLSLEDVRKIMS